VELPEVLGQAQSAGIAIACREVTSIEMACRRAKSTGRR
jgi:hypothetical protein